MLSFLFLINHSGEDLADLDHGDDGEAKSESDTVFCPADSCHTEYSCDRLNENYHAGEGKRKNSCSPKPHVLSLEGEDRAVERSHVEGVEHLTHCKSEEGHCGSVNAVGDLKVTCFEPMSDEIRSDGYDGHEEALIEHGKAETACEDAFL